MRKILMTAAALSLGLTTAQAADSVADFYKGKTIRIVVGVAAGSGYDLNARTLARYLPKHIPGNPNIIVQNQPGAGGVVSANSLYNVGPFDGTAIGAAFGGVPTAPLLTPDGVRFDPVKLQWLGSTNRETHDTNHWHTSPVKKWDDILTHETVVGAQAPGSTQYDFPILANAIFHTKFKVVTGYNGTPAINLAMERGEIEGNGATAYTTLKAIAGKWLAEKKVRIIAQWALRPNPELPGVPSVFEMAKNPDDKSALQLAMARLDFGRPFFLPPKVPADRVAALRKAFDDTMKDPEFLAEAKKEKLDIDPVDGKAMDKLVADVIATPKPVVERVRDILDAKKKK
jgi:tripartite-type tricarboxylate transporter receptor subunit TctC